MNLNKDLTIIIVLYRSSKIIFDCLKSLNNFKIIIVDNGHNEKVLTKLNIYKNIEKIISKKRNLGFGNAINFAFEYIKTDYFLVLNPDVTLDENSIKELLTLSKKNSNCAISAPYIATDNDGYAMLPENGKSVLRTNDQISCSKLLNNLKPSGDLCVQVTKGCALLINSKHFTDVGMFSTKFFLFWEEIDLCRKFLKKKLSIIVSSNAFAHHKVGTSAKMSLSVYITRIFHSEKSPLLYYNVKKNSSSIYFIILKYLFRSLSYFCILNLKNSLKNIIKLSAIMSYIFFS
jgi:GT2 family glycosyltransferase